MFALPAKCGVCLFCAFDGPLRSSAPSVSAVERSILKILVLFLKIRSLYFRLIVLWYSGWSLIKQKECIWEFGRTLKNFLTNAIPVAILHFLNIHPIRVQPYILNEKGQK